MTNPQTSRDLTDNQINRRGAARQAEAIAGRIDTLASRIRFSAKEFNDETQPAARIIADIVNDYVQSGNNIGSSFWNMIRDLSEMK
jgi:hypothetical protein